MEEAIHTSEIYLELGTAETFKYHSINTIHSLQDQAICLPDQNNRKEIATCMFAKYDWVNCIGIANGTLFQLTYKPQSEHAPDYHGHKFVYSLTTLMNDDKKRIQYYLVRFPGSVHDNHVWNHSDLYQNQDD